MESRDLFDGRYLFFTSREIKPSGWLKRQLRIQAEGLAGNLDRVWPDVRDSRWIGGDREGWERVPYWLDGFVPLAWLLEDARLIARAKKYIDAIIDSQCADGWICPCAEEEREIALKLHKIARTDSRIGFEASNHYFYTLNDLREKVINCTYILEQLGKEA